MQTTSTKRHQSSQNASSPLSCQSLTLLGKWLECAPKDRLCSILKKLCEEQAIAHEVFNAMTAHDIEAKLTDIISEGDESKKDGNAGGVRGDLAIPRGLQQKEIADTGTKTGNVARKRKIKQHNSDDGESDEDVYDSNHPREAVYKRVKIGDGATTLKEKKGVQNVETLATAGSKHEHYKVAKCKNCDEAYNLCFKDEICQYHPRQLEIDRSYSGWEQYDIWNEDEWNQLDDEEFHNEHPDGFSFPCCDGGPKSEGCQKGVHVPAKSRAENGVAVLSNKNA